MAHHQSAKKRIRQDEKKRLHNRYYKNQPVAIKKVREMEDPTEAEKQLPALFSMIDRLSKRNLFHANKAANLKSGLALAHKASRLGIYSVYELKSLFIPRDGEAFCSEKKNAPQERGRVKALQYAAAQIVDPLIAYLKYPPVIISPWSRVFSMNSLFVVSPAQATPAI